MRQSYLRSEADDGMNDGPHPHRIALKIRRSFAVLACDKGAS